MTLQTKQGHTPGPWRVITYEEWEKLHQDGAHYFSSVAQVNPSGYLDYLICQCADKGSLQKTRANARLIAAAPDLLEACKAAYEVLADIPGGLTSAFNAAYKCRNAIANAEGRG